MNSVRTPNTELGQVASICFSLGKKSSWLLKTKKEKEKEAAEE
jgi:hypothetical protein